MLTVNEIYWQNRWKTQGSRGGVSPVEMEDIKYIERQKRDTFRIDEALKTYKKDFMENKFKGFVGNPVAIFRSNRHAT